MAKFDLEYVGAERLAQDMEYDVRRDLRLDRLKSYAWRFRKIWSIALNTLRENNLIPLEERQRQVLIFFRREIDFWQ